MHQAILSPMVGGGGIPRGFDCISFPVVDCLQSAFSLKIRLVLISSSAIANHDVVFSRLPASPLACLGFALTLQRKTRDCSQSIPVGGE